MRNSSGRRSAAAVVLGLALLAPTAARPDSAPDLGRPFEPTPISEPLYGIQNPTDANDQRRVVEAADGTDLYVETWLPAPKDGNVPPARIPVVVTFSPYVVPGPIRAPFLQRARDALVPRGYAFALAHLRGTGGSQGCVQRRGPLEVDDTARVVQWLGEQAPWSDGNVGAYGRSYAGGTAVGVAARGDKALTQSLKAIVALAPFSSLYEYFYADGVKFFLKHEVAASVYHVQYGIPTADAPVELAQRVECLPEHQIDAMDQTGGITEFLKARDDRVGAHSITAATLVLHGHADTNVFPSVQAGLFDQIPDSTPKAGLFGWWAHEDTSDRAPSGITPDWIRLDYMDMVIAWFDRYLKGLPSGVEEWPVAQVQGNDGQWRAEPDWPTTGGPVGQLAFGADGQLGGATPDGSSSYTEGFVENAVTPLAPGTYVTFTTPPLPERLEITGQPVADLWVTVDRPDANIAVRLETFAPDGTRLGERTKDNQGRLIDTGATRGFRSVRFLDPLVDNRFWQSEGAAPPVDTPIRVPVRLYPTDLVVPQGGWIEVTIAGSLIADGGLESTPTLVTGRVVRYPSVLEDPSSLSGSATTVTILHDCEHLSAVRFLMPRADPDLLNVREVDEPAGQPLADNRPFVAPVSDAGGLATAPVCGQAPIRLENFGHEIP